MAKPLLQKDRSQGIGLLQEEARASQSS
jgi:hypothetical protein